MNKHDALLKQIRKRAGEDREKRKDVRFLETMGFLVAKGFLRVNFDVPHLPNKRIQIDDAMWAGLNVEPRILEVLPAAVLRLEKHFDLDPIKHPELAQVVALLRKGSDQGPDFLDMPFKKVKVWAEFPLRDKRVKGASQKKIVRTFRLNPDAVEKLRTLAKTFAQSETRVLEQMILGSSPKRSEFT